MAFKFPFSTLHELNLDWILEKVKYLIENNEEFNNKADYAVETADEAKEIAEQAAQAIIPDGAVTTVKIADRAVTGNKIAQATIATDNLTAGCVTNPYILDGAVNAPKLATDAVTTDKIQNQSVTNTKVERNYTGEQIDRTDHDSIVNTWSYAQIINWGAVAEFLFSANVTIANDYLWHTIGTTPATLKPQKDIETTIVNDGGSNTLTLRILHSTGEVQLRNVSTTATDKTFQVNECYLVSI